MGLGTWEHLMCAELGRVGLWFLRLKQLAVSEVEAMPAFLS